MRVLAPIGLLEIILSRCVRFCELHSFSRVLSSLGIFWQRFNGFLVFLAVALQFEVRVVSLEVDVRVLDISKFTTRGLA